MKIKIYKQEPIEDRQKKIVRLLKKLGGNSYDDIVDLIGACNGDLQARIESGEVVRPR